MKKIPYSVLCGLFAFTSVNAAEPPQTQPKLIVQITVDGLRADLIQRYKHQFGENGFRYLMDQGAYFTNANYEHANTETIVGHVSLATGAPPSVHGMVGNVWFDRSKDRLVYNVEDSNYNMLTKGAGVNKETEVDPTQKVAKKDGRSPLPMLSSTFSDELSIATNGQAKIFSVSVKDRGAISLGGDNGKAFWFSKSKHQFVTSNYYYQQYPEWVNAWNQQDLAASYGDKAWTLSQPESTYAPAVGNGDHKVGLAGFSKHFPHPYGPAKGKYFGTLLTLSPAGDELTADFAKTILKEEKLGQDNITDYLSVSFSSTDYVSHMFGPSTRETEDNLIRLDRTLADLFSNIDNQVGLKNVVIAFSADHGVPEAAPVSQDTGDHDAHYFEQDKITNPALDARLQQAFGLGNELIRLYAQPYIYLNTDLIKKNNLSVAKVENVIAEEMLKITGISAAITKTDIEKNSLPQTRINKLVQQNYHPQRSGNIHLVFSSRTYINNMDGLTIASTHGSPWRYDTHVPVIFAGYNVKSQIISRNITPYDIAPTLSNILGINLPSGATGDVLTEVTSFKQ
ncbi:alkaline phosphatase family protein [Moritella dasanensis]|uniref:alkaline phosphatase family protein n=1 Tax=Moritella dasanensis TaxID=428031 RepID=UPI0002E37B4A|nr:alkaline phosphatase family protein [Moritella dasanensis]